MPRHIGPSEAEQARMLADLGLADLEALAAQIACDAATAEQLLGSAGGVGVGQAPADEGGNSPQQQNP